ncbi:MAG: nucleotidyl transferase AbiEii/AbiGii toxin family protein [Candidatus Pacebacteria bacterium]|nr:nucleotidyl transferase AbiEii/AbiGii toxin family protein [Candidatus Paceibacterota bacterium]MDD5753004.1 nucleotidyl transferase AbiEii/AbiGii toxin family protein [Candidatus Paceibacterota bacterium]
MESIFKIKESVNLSFMGGTAIRIIYGSYRFSEDLDFDNFGLSFNDFKKIMDLTVKDMSLKGFNVEFRFVEKDTFHCYIKFPSMFYSFGLSDHINEKILIRIDTIKKKKNIKPESVFLNKFGIYKKILVNPANVILSQKLIAALNRKTQKGRDFYDISYLYGFTEPNFNFIKDFLNKDKETFIKEFLKQCESLNFKSLAKDVEPFLIDSQSVERVINFKEFIFLKFK